MIVQQFEPASRSKLSRSAHLAALLPRRNTHSEHAVAGLAACRDRAVAFVQGQ